jgi:Concanavalin A-like lectin/glucanases superfamily/Hydrazine synthase alpha subunit middle domain/WD40-like Beta Propeller Repeat
VDGVSQGLMALLCVPALVAAPSPPEGRFGTTAVTRDAPLLAGANEAYRQFPLTVECWAKLDGKSGFNILIANEPKSSGTHWEVYSYVGSGFFSAYFPGYAPGEVKSSVDITDGRWHYLAMVSDGARVRLYVDGRQCADVPIARLPDPPPQPGPLAFGQLAEGGLGCDGMVDEVRISRTLRDPTVVPEAPFACDAETIGLWHFEPPADGKTYPDESPLHNDAVDPFAGAPFRNPRWTPGSLVVMPPEPDLAKTRTLLTQALSALKLPSLEGAERTRDGVLDDWEEQWFHLDAQLRGAEPLPRGAAEQVYDRQALVWDSDGDPVGVVLRRTTALLDCLADMPNPSGLDGLRHDLDALKAAAQKVPVNDGERRKGLYLAASALSRKVAFANPLLDFDRLLFVARGVYAGSRKTGPRTTRDDFGQHFATQYYGFNSVPGGGLFILRGYKAEPKLVNLLRDSVIASGRLKGRKLEPGAFLSPDLSFDGRTITFAYTQSKEHKWEWSPETAYHVFRVNADGTDLVQLTDGRWDDFDPCWLPNGRIAFISERRGGYIRCFVGLTVPNHVLHSMNADGSDLKPISYYETSEWHPSVNNDGMIVYTRWDYTDRENCLGSNIWLCFPDGSDPRAPHGNYPYPWHTFPDNTQGDSRLGRPYTEMNIRAVPNSPLYIMTAAPHHGEAFGALVMLDLRVPDDGFMSQLRRITPYVPFPETESPARSQYAYGTPWPLSEDFTLCNWWENLYLLDRFGNQTLLCENSLVSGDTDWNMRLIDPIPLRPRPRPPIVTVSADEGEPHRPATIGVVNVYDSELPFPEGTRIRWLRVTQNILKLNATMGVPMIGYQNENTPRIPLGIVPVEDDGSAYFETPAGRELIFQVLDGNHMAVQSMRSVAFVHPGERLTCQGCHEDKAKAPALVAPPRALARAPSKLTPEIGPIEPISYYRTVKPVLERSCLPCHQREGKEPLDWSYEALEPYVFYFAGGMSGTTIKPIHGGSRTIPGRFGARASRMGQALLNETHRATVSPEDYRKVVLWLDSNSLRLGAYDDEESQLRGELVWPTLDVDPGSE